MKTLKIFFLLYLCLFSSCDNDDEVIDCSAVSCLAAQIFVELIDGTDGTNYSIKNQLELSDFEFLIRDENSNLETAAVDLVENQENEAILVLPFAERSTIVVNNNQNIPITMTFNTDIISDCCASPIENAEAINNESTFDITSNTLRIIL